MEPRPIQFVGDEIGFEIRSNIMHVDMGAAGDLAIPLAVFERAHRRSGEVIREHYAKRAEVVEFRREYPAEKRLG